MKAINKTASLSLCPLQGRGKQLSSDLSIEQSEKKVTEAKRTARTFLVSLLSKDVFLSILIILIFIFLVLFSFLFFHYNKVQTGYNLVSRIELNCGGEAGAKVQAVHVTPLEGVTCVVFGAI